MLEKMIDTQVAEDIVKSGLVSEHLSTGKGKLEQGVLIVLKKMREFGSVSGVRQWLAEVSLYENSTSIEETKSMMSQILREKNSRIENKNIKKW